MGENINWKKSPFKNILKKSLDVKITKYRNGFEDEDPVRHDYRKAKKAGTALGNYKKNGTGKLQIEGFLKGLFPAEFEKMEENTFQSERLIPRLTKYVAGLSKKNKENISLSSLKDKARVSRKDVTKAIKKEIQRKLSRKEKDEIKDILDNVKEDSIKSQEDKIDMTTIREVERDYMGKKPVVGARIKLSRSKINRLRKVMDAEDEPLNSLIEMALDKLLEELED